MLAAVLVNLPFGGARHVRKYILPDGTVTNDLEWARYLLSTMDGNLTAEIDVTTRKKKRFKMVSAPRAVALPIRAYDEDEDFIFILNHI